MTNWKPVSEPPPMYRVVILKVRQRPENEIEKVSAKYVMGSVGPQWRYVSSHDVAIIHGEVIEWTEMPDDDGVSKEAMEKAIIKANKQVERWTSDRCMRDQQLCYWTNLMFEYLRETHNADLLVLSINGVPETDGTNIRIHFEDAVAKSLNESDGTKDSRGLERLAKAMGVTKDD